MTKNFRFITIAALILTALLLSSCLSVGPPADGYRSILLIDRDIKLVNQFESFVHYELYLDGDKKNPYTTFKASSLPLIVEGLEPGEHTVTGILAVRDDGEGRWPVEGSEGSFTLEDGAASVYDQTVLVTFSIEKGMTTGAETWYSQKATLEPITDEDKADTVAFFQKRDKDGYWRIID